MSRDGSGVCELTNQSRLGICKAGERALKETGAKTEDRVRNPMHFLRSKACKSIPVITQNTIMNLEMSIISLH